MQAAFVPHFFRAPTRWLLAPLFVVLALVPQIARAQAPGYGFVDQCYAVADELPGSANLQTDTLTRLDRATGQSYVIGQTGTTNMENLAFGPVRTLYGVDGGQLGILNVNTGVFTALPSAIGTGRGSAGNIALNNVDGLSYDIARDLFFAIHRRNDGTTNATVRPDLLFAINPQTGALIPDQFGPGIDYVVVPPILGVDGLLLGDVDDISFHPATGELYGLLNTNGAGARLVTIDVNTGAIDTGEVIRYPDPYPQNPALAGQIIDDIEGLSFFNTGRLFASTGTNGPDPVDLNSLFEIDIAASTGVLVGPFPNQPPGAAPRDYEGLACLTAEAALVLDKFTNGPGQLPEDADEPTGPYIQAGETVTWTYLFTNTSFVTLTDFSLVDDRVGTINCPPANTLLAPGDSFTCTATGTATVGQYTNTATITGTSQIGLLTPRQTVTSTDPSHYFGMSPAIAIKKYTNGEDADTPTGPLLPVGSAVTWTYVVTNTGSDLLTNVTVTDDQGVAVSCPKDTLAVGEVMTCTAGGIATAGQYANIGTVTGTPPAGPNVAAADPSHYFGFVIPPAPAQVGDLVWLDDNANGVQDPSESGVSGVEVRLYTAAATLVQTQLTAPGGLYLFTGVAPGSYYIVFINTHTDTAFTAANQGGDDARDGDVDLALPTGLPGDNAGRTAIFILAPGADDRTWDAGLVSVPGQGTGAIGDRVWNDTDEDGLQDAGEIGAPGVTVRLYTNVAGVITLLRTTTTDALGLYRFDNLSAGQYLVEFVAPPERTLSPRNVAGATAENDSDADLVTGRTAVITLPDGVTDLSWDAGISVMPNAEPPTDEPGQRPSLFIPLISR